MPSKEDLQNIDFIVDKEEWNKYRTEDGALIYVKYILLRFFQYFNRELNKPEYRVNGETKTTIRECPMHLRADPTFQPKPLDINIKESAKKSDKNNMTMTFKIAPLMSAFFVFIE